MIKMKGMSRQAWCQTFVTNSNNIEAQFYDDSIGPLILVRGRLICQGQNYSITETFLELNEKG